MASFILQIELVFNENLGVTELLLSLIGSFQSLRDHDENTLPNGVNESSREETPVLESIDDTQSIEIDMQSQISEVNFIYVKYA